MPSGRQSTGTSVRQKPGRPFIGIPDLSQCADFTSVKYLNMCMVVIEIHRLHLHAFNRNIDFLLLAWGKRYLPMSVPVAHTARSIFLVDLRAKSGSKVVSPSSSTATAYAWQEQRYNRKHSQILKRLWWCLYLIHRTIPRENVFGNDVTRSISARDTSLSRMTRCFPPSGNVRWPTKFRMRQSACQNTVNMFL